MRKLPVILCALSCCSVFGTSPAAAEDTAGKDTTIHTTIVIRSKAGECPPGFTVFQMDSGKKLPPGPKICFVRAAKPAAK